MAARSAIRILDGAYQPAGTVVLFLLVLLLFSGSGTRQASVWLVTVAMAFNLAADVLWGLAAAGHLGDSGDAHRRWASTSPRTSPPPARSSIRPSCG